MAYATIASLQERLGALLYARLTDRTNGTTADNTVAQRILDDAEAEVNAALRQRYIVPVDPGADAQLAFLLRAKTLDAAEIAAWRQSPFTSELPNRIQRQEARLREWLEAVATGRMELPAARLPMSERVGAAQAALRSTRRRFSEDELSRW
jgi:phage gp36-like protein